MKPASSSSEPDNCFASQSLRIWAANSDLSSRQSQTSTVHTTKHPSEDGDASALALVSAPSSKEPGCSRATNFGTLLSNRCLVGSLSNVNLSLQPFLAFTPSNPWWRYLRAGTLPSAGSAWEEMNYDKKEMIHQPSWTLQDWLWSAAGVKKAGVKKADITRASSYLPDLIFNGVRVFPPVPDILIMPTVHDMRRCHRTEFIEYVPPSSFRGAAAFLFVRDATSSFSPRLRNRFKGNDFPLSILP